MSRIAITGGTGFVGRHLARALSRDGHEVVLIARGRDHRDEAIRQLDRTRFVAAGLDNEDVLTDAFAGCDGVAHCAGINREIGTQTYQRVHIDGTRNVVNAARRAGMKKILHLSFLRARPDCGSGYHESKWAAEESVRDSRLDYTILKPAVIYGQGDHMLDHLSHALHTIPIFALVGMKDRMLRPVAVQDVVKIIRASLIENRLSKQTVAIVGPEQVSLRDTVRRVGDVIDRRPVIIPSPVFLHYLLAWIFERGMAIPLVSTAQVRILSEGVAEPCTPCDALPDDLKPSIRFDEQHIREGLPEPKSFGLSDCRCVAYWRT